MFVLSLEWHALCHTVGSFSVVAAAGVILCNPPNPPPPPKKKQPKKTKKQKQQQQQQNRKKQISLPFPLGVYLFGLIDLVLGAILLVLIKLQPYTLCSPPPRHPTPTAAPATRIKRRGPERGREGAAVTDLPPMPCTVAVSGGLPTRWWCGEQCHKNKRESRCELHAHHSSL